MHTVLDPSMLFISESDWQDEAQRNAFLDHLLSNLNTVSEHQITRFYWTEELEALLWLDPCVPPWRIERDWKLSLIPVINRLLRNLIDEIPVEFEGSCTCYPELFCVQEKEEAVELTCKLISQLIVRQENFFFCLGINNAAFNGSTFRFTHTEREDAIEPIPIRRSSDWLPHIDINMYWPDSFNSDEITKFKKAINLTAEIYFDKQAEDLIYECNFSEDFIVSLSQVMARRDEILYSITRRLLVNQNEASHDNGLNDEPVRGKKGERRFRVSRSCRIHYAYPNRQTVMFLRYYGEGEHDTGL